MVSRRDWLLALGAAACGSAAARLQAWPIDDARLPAPQIGPRPAFDPDVEIALTAAPAEAQILAGRPTQVWQFRGRVLKGPPESLQPVANSYLGPTIRVTRGQRVRVRFQNHLPEPSIVHWHGLDVPEHADGHPRLAIPSGAEYVYEFPVTNRAGTYWYHPHPHMKTGPQVYSGLAGLFIVSDEEEAAIGLPAGDDELIWVLQDRRFDDANQFVYSTSMMDMETGMLGNRVLVNGRERPIVPVESRAYRIRVLNGSNARIYKLAWSDGTPITVLGVDGGLLEQPHAQPFVTLAPAQRVDVWLDLSQRPVGAALELRSAAFNAGDAGLVMGMMMGGGGPGALPLGAPIALVSLRVATKVVAAPRLPARLSTFDRHWAPVGGLSPRPVPLTFAAMQWTIAGRPFAMDEVAADETVTPGSTHQWDFVNAGGMMGMQMAHPIHLHGRQFRVISRTGGAATNTLRAGLVDAGWTDTVLVLPHETVRVQVTFSGHAGLFLYHCHILEHEDMGMMRNFRIRP